MKKTNKKYFICPYCADLKTETGIMLDCEGGGLGMCDCQFTTLYWNPNSQDLNVQTNRSYYDYVEISKSWYDCLKEYDNHIIRRDAFEAIPILKRMDEQ